MGGGDLIGVIGAVVGIAGGIVGYTRFVAQAPLQAKVANLEAELEREQERERDLREKQNDAATEAASRISELESRYQLLLQDFSNLKRGKSGVLIKSEIDGMLERAMSVLGAREASVLVPSPPPASSLVFLSIFGPAAAKLRYSKLPLGKGKAGKVFATGRVDNAANPRKDPEFFESMDEKGGYTTATLLTVPLQCNGATVGVAQFLNKEGNRAFTPEDEATASELARDMAGKAADFIRDSTNFEGLGLSTERDGRQESIVFCDLSASSQLFERVSPKDAIDCINEYFDRHSEVAIANGAIVDNYLGDGIMLRFGPHDANDRDYPARAATAALAMRDDFDSLKQSWLNFEMDVDDLFDRFGVATGLVFEAIFGHRNIRQVTVIGDTVNRAANLVEASTRTRNVILIDDDTRAALGETYAIEKLPEEIATRVKVGPGPYFELLGLAVKASAGDMSHQVITGPTG